MPTVWYGCNARKLLFVPFTLMQELPTSVRHPRTSAAYVCRQISVALAIVWKNAIIRTRDAAIHQYDSTFHISIHLVLAVETERTVATLPCFRCSCLINALLLLLGQMRHSCPLQPIERCTLACGNAALVITVQPE
jgi:hypothetical protein